MIKYVCDKCNEEIKNRNAMVIITTVTAGGGKKNSHYCGVCAAPALKALEDVDESEPVEDNDTSSDLKEETVAESSEALKAEKEVDDSVNESVSIRGKSYTMPTMSDGRTLKDFFKQERNRTVIYCDAIADREAALYLTLSMPEKTNARGSVAGRIGAIISFYRGQLRQGIMAKHKMDALEYGRTMHKFISLPIYERWFSNIPFSTKSGDKIKVGEVLSMIEAHRSIEEIVSETNVVNQEQVFEILEYYTGLEFTDLMVQRYISETGGHKA